MTLLRFRLVSSGRGPLAEGLQCTLSMGYDFAEEPSMPGKSWIACGALLAAGAVAAGAVGAHVLKEVVKLSESQLETYDVAVRYQMYHALGLIAVGVLIGRARSAWLTAAAAAFVTGCILFSGGIYAWLATENQAFIQVVPIGGTAWIIGWLLFAVGAIISRAGWPDQTKLA